jgi:hypothetical protein
LKTKNKSNLILSLMAATASFLPVNALNAQQASPTLQDLISGNVACNDPRVLGAPVDPAGIEQKAPGVSAKDFLFIGCVAERLLNGNRVKLPNGFPTSWTLSAVHSDQVNSRVVQQGNQLHVLAYDSIPKFVDYDPGEEAFVIGHEIGHIQDWANCRTGLQAAAANRSLFRQHELILAQQHCEISADSYGLQFMWGAGFDPLAAAAFFGRFEMYQPNQTTGLGSRIANYTQDHPISPERVKKLRADTIMLCSRPGTVCQR